MNSTSEFSSAPAGTRSAPGTLLAKIDPPAFVVDFPEDAGKQAALDALWSASVNRWITAAQVGDVWDLVNYGPRPAFYNPLVTPTPSDAAVAPIAWNAFPGRILALFPDATADQWNQWADSGPQQSVTTDLCSGDTIKPKPYGPTGPRGGQDEYCEWSVMRDAAGKITSVMFTCENPEYWMTLWQVDPQAVLALYHELVSPAVTLDHLSLLDANGAPVIDPTTQNRAYNPLNKWNSGTSSLATSGGAVHLTSSPNTLGAEFDLAAAATMPRKDGSGEPVTSASALVCCGRYGQIGRHSDPTIGQNVNYAINGDGPTSGRIATLTNPPGLYMQTPDFTRFAVPAGHQQDNPADFWTVVRGHAAGANEPIDRILHAVYAVPADKGYTVSDLTIDGVPIHWGSQIAATITMKLAATVFAAGGANQTAVTCTAPATSITPAAQGLQPASVFTAYRTLEAASGELLFSVPVLALLVGQGTTLPDVALWLNVDPPSDLRTLAVSAGEGVTITVTDTATLAGVPVLLATVVVAPHAAPGDRDIRVIITGNPESRYPVSGLLAVTAGSAQRLTRARIISRAGRA